MKLPFLIFILPLLASANMWDNLFEGQGVPFQLPYNFTASLAPTGFSDIIMYNILSITEKNGLSINTTTPLLINNQTSNNQTVLSQIKFNFTTGTMFAYSAQKGCVVLKNESLFYDNFYAALEGILELVLLLNSQDTENQYKRVELQTLLKLMNVSSCITNMALYFQNDTTLSIIENYYLSNSTSSFTVQSVGQQNMTLSEFKPQSDWTCESMKLTKINGTYYVVDDGPYVSSDDDDMSDSDINTQSNIVRALGVTKNDASQPESLVDLILDFLIPINLDTQESQLLHAVLEELLINYAGCNSV